LYLASDHLPVFAKFVFKTDSTTPVELLNFNGTLIDNKIQLEWSTATEKNNLGFDVERASTSLGKNLEKIGFVRGSGNSTSFNNYVYVDDQIKSFGNYSYRLKQIDLDGTFKYYCEVSVEYSGANNFYLSQNFPNPFNPSTSISYTIPFDSRVVIKIYNALGQEVALLKDENITAGNYEVKFNAASLPSGIYFYRMSAEASGGEKFFAYRKMAVLK